jgi:hypothetical protein
MGGSIQASPFHRRDHSLAGFVLSGRWPDTTREWAQFLVLAVRIAAVPGMVLSTAVFRAIEEVPDDPQPGTVGLVTDEGPVLSHNGPKPGAFYCPQPPALLVLHPPTETFQSADSHNAASGCVLLPGIPHLGLGHRAAWVEAESDGTVTKLVSANGVDPMSDPDLAVLASLCDNAA